MWGIYIYMLANLFYVFIIWKKKKKTWNAITELFDDGRRMLQVLLTFFFFHKGGKWMIWLIDGITF